MNQVNCPVCGNKCIKAGKTKAGSQRWLCRKCNSSVTHKRDNSAKQPIQADLQFFGRVVYFVCN